MYLPGLPAAAAPAGHPHAAHMLEYAQDAAVTLTPWVLWQYQDAACNGRWTTCHTHPVWHPGAQYRRKPKTIRIGAFDVPEPMRVAPANGTVYFAVDLTQPKGVDQFYWGRLPQDFRCLGSGIAHGTREAAELHARALLSFTTQTATEAPTSV